MSHSFDETNLIWCLGFSHLQTLIHIESRKKATQTPISLVIEFPLLLPICIFRISAKSQWAYRMFPVRSNHPEHPFTASFFFSLNHSLLLFGPIRREEYVAAGAWKIPAPEHIATNERKGKNLITNTRKSENTWTRTHGAMVGGMGKRSAVLMCWAVESRHRAGRLQRNLVGHGHAGRCHAVSWDN